MNDNELKQTIKKSLDGMTDDIDVATQVKLNQARQAAINPKPMNRIKPWHSLVFVSCAIVLVVSMVWLQSPNDEFISQPETLWLEDLDILATEAEPEFYQDLEFLAWLGENELLDSEI